MSGTLADDGYYRDVSGNSTNPCG